MQIDLTPEQPNAAAANNAILNPVQGDPTLNDPSQPLTFSEHTEVDLQDVTFKGVIPLGLRFTGCRRLSIVGTIASTQTILRTIDPVYLISLEQFNLTVTDAEEENFSSEKPSHLLLVLNFIEQVSSIRLKSVRIGFNKVYLAHLLTAFSPSGVLITEQSDPAIATQNVVFSKASQLF